MGTKIFCDIPHESILLVNNNQKIYENEIISGVIFDPIKNEIFYGEKNSGSFYNNNRIRVSKKNVLDDDALIDALQNKKIYAAGLDVFNNEPKLDERYLKLDNCFTLPHIGSANHETRAAMSMLAVKNIEAHFSDKKYPSKVV